VVNAVEKNEKNKKNLEAQTTSEIMVDDYEDLNTLLYTSDFSSVFFIVLIYLLLFLFLTSF
jgi:hypothetical protein